MPRRTCSSAHVGARSTLSLSDRLGQNRAVRRLALLLATFGTVACSQDPCRNAAPAVTAEVRVSDPGLRARAASMEVVLTVGEARFSRTFDLLGTLDDGAAVFSVVLEPAPVTEAYPIELDVVAYTSPGGRGERIAEGSSSIRGSLDACNRVVVELGEAATKDAGETADGGVADGGPDAGGSFLIVSPSEIDRPWVDRGAVLTFTATVTAGDGAALDDLTATTTVSWATPALSPGDGATARTLSVTVDTALLPEGPYTAVARVARADSSSTPAELRVRFRSFRPIHVGPAANACLRDDPAGAAATDCDFAGEDGLETAASELTPYSHVVVHDDAGGRAYYTTGAGIGMPGISWISGAAGAAPQNVVLGCRDGLAIWLNGDGVRVEGLMIVSEGGCDLLINTWGGSTPRAGTRGHIIDRVVLAALRPEVFGANNTEEAIALSGDTQLTNSHVYGYWAGLGDLSFADHTKIVNDSVVFYQRVTGSDARGTLSLTFANNTVIAVPGADGPLLEASASTHDLTVSGNVVEGFTPLVAGLDVSDTSNRVVANTENADEIDTPMEPRFLADALARTDAVAGIGVSLDGVDIDGRTAVLPGAFQLRSARDGPQRDWLVVGPEGCGFCDVTSDLDNELQVAAWSSWPGGTIEIEPGTYAGNTVVSWRTRILGKAGSPSEIVLESAEEDPLLERAGTWAHRSVLTMIDANRDGFDVENLTVRVDPLSSTDQTAILVESRPESPPNDSLELRNLVIESASAGGARGETLAHALLIGEDVLVQDVLVHGAFEACVRLASHLPSAAPASPVFAAVVNLTCRLTDTAEHAPRAAFELAGADSPLFINLAVESAAAAPLFAAQRRASGDNGASALDPPLAFEAYNVSWRGANSLLGDFAIDDGDYILVDVDELPAGEPFFVSDTDDHLEVGSAAIDSGVDPAAVVPWLEAGDSIEWVDRTGRLIDRGAYEQGN